MPTNVYCEICTADDHIDANCPYNASDNDELYVMEGGAGGKPFAGNAWEKARYAYITARPVDSDLSILTSESTDMQSNQDIILKYLYQQLQSTSNRETFIEEMIEPHFGRYRSEQLNNLIQEANDDENKFVELAREVTWKYRGARHRKETDTVVNIISGNGQTVYEEWRKEPTGHESDPFVPKSEAEDEPGGEDESAKIRARARWKQVKRHASLLETLHLQRLIKNFASSAEECNKVGMEAGLIKAQGSINFINPMKNKFNDHLEQCDNIELSKDITKSILDRLSEDDREKLLSNFGMSSFTAGEGETTINVASFSKQWGEICDKAKETSFYSRQHSTLVALEWFLGFFFT